MNLLLSSNSTLYGESYLQFCKNHINNFLEESNAKNVIFIPFAAVSFSYDEYEKMVTSGLDNSNITLKSIHHFEDKKDAISNAEAIIVGGGNTFHLLYQVYETGIYNAIQEKVKTGTPYIGWSAGSNLACPTIKTTNDMPVIEPPSFNALNFIPFQINPHYLDANPEGHNGETREQRLIEFLAVNKHITVTGLREGCIFKIIDKTIKLIGNKSVRIFKYGQEPKELTKEDDLSFLLTN